MRTHHIAIAATDGTLESSLNFAVRVYGATTGASPSPSTPGKPESPNKPENPEETTRFRDLAGYDWAKDAIESLAKDGVIKGTSADTFEPGCDITRADFALLVMRALHLEAEPAEPFADVKPSDYFAEELAVAKACGIIRGVGDNRCNPRGKITREDMMTMIKRALKLAAMTWNRRKPMC